MEDHNDVKIKSNQLLSMTECIICSETFNKCCVTKCGHSFCEKCILNCINLKNCCPTCKTSLNKSDLIKDFMIDDIVTYIKKERSKEEYNNIEKNYMKNLDGNVSLKMNYIQTVFFENLKQIFNTYNSFYEKVELEKKMKINEINNCIEELTNLGGNNSRIEEYEIKKKEIDSNHINLIRSIETSLEQYMKNLPESPLDLPIKTKIYIEKKKANIDHLSFNPTDNTDKLYEIITNYFKNVGDEITDFNDSAFYVIRKNYQTDINSMLIESETELKINKSQKFIATGLISGEVLIFRGNYILKSQEPKSCITYEFEKNFLNSNLEYFSCETCKINWICHICIANCHSEHSYKFFRNNLATWACCYCYKTKCLLKNNKKII